MMKKWYRFRRSQIFIFLLVMITYLVYYISVNTNLIERNLDLTRSFEWNQAWADDMVSSMNALLRKMCYAKFCTKWQSFINVVDRNAQISLLSYDNLTSAYLKNNLNRSSINEYIEEKLQEALKEDKGMGCHIPRLDPFAKEIMQFDKKKSNVECPGEDWVKCYLHECKVVKKVAAKTKNIKCSYEDIIYISDAKYIKGVSKTVYGEDAYVLKKSDHVKVLCTGTAADNTTAKWMGYAIGYRSIVGIPRPRSGPIDVLIFGFDSTSKNGFIRKMPKSYEYITKKLNATLLNGYNIVGDGTPAALFPILTGKTELELPDMRRVVNKGTLDSFPFLFYKLKDLGFHTAYFEDMPSIGTFQYRFNGFQRQPADHYLRAYFLETAAGKWFPVKPAAYCVGDTPRYELMMNITEQFMKLPGSHFGFTFIADITHDDFNLISTADIATVRFLHALNTAGHLNNTLLFVMGDHGPRYADVRDTFQGKLEERLPLMAVYVPPALTERRPHILEHLVKNAEVLTTPHDIHATILDALQMKEHMNPYKIKGTDLPRGMTLFEPIPASRSCSEAGIEPHWCACLTWKNVSTEHPLHSRAAEAFVNYINTLTESVRDKCVPRTLTSIAWVMSKTANTQLLTFKGARDQDGYVGNFNSKVKHTRDYYQIKVSVGPGYGTYEASAAYIIKEDKFIFDIRDISRINAYSDEPSCISKTHPHLNMYCYCKDHVPNT